MKGKFRIKRILFFATVKNIYYIVRRRTTGSICRAWRIFRPLREQLQYLFSIDERAYYLAESEAAPGEGWEALPTGKLRSLPRRTRIFAAAAGESLYRWYSSQRFCGRCGARMGKSKVERAMVCPACGQHGLSEDLPGGHRRGA